MPTNKKDFLDPFSDSWIFSGTSRIFKKTIFPEQLLLAGGENKTLFSQMEVSIKQSRH